MNYFYLFSLIIISFPFIFLILALLRYLWYKGSNEKKKHRQ